MTIWDGTGLPPAATARLARARADGVRTSFLSVPGQVGLDASGFVTVGEVMGCIVEHIGFQGYGGCGYYGLGYGQMGGFSPYGGYGQGGYGQAATTVSSAGGFVGFAPYVDALYAGWEGAIGRMRAEAAALGADGIIGVRLEVHNLGDQNQEFMALGTAVAARGQVHVRDPFATTLDGQDVAKLLAAGWVPAAILVAISVAIRHDDYQTRLATQMYAGNVEVPGYTELANHVRDDARAEFATRAARAGGDGAIVSFPMTLRIHELEVAENHRDHVGEATLIGTAIARYAQRAVPSPRLVLSMRDLR